MENADRKNWNQLIKLVLKFYDYGCSNIIISTHFNLDMIYVYGILLEYRGTLGWNERKEINNDNLVYSGSTFWTY